MSDDNWDLSAVVRSCKTANTATTATATATTATEEALSCLASLTFEEEKDPFSFPNLFEPRTNRFEELQFYKPSFQTSELGASSSSFRTMVTTGRAYSNPGQSSSGFAAFQGIKQEKQELNQPRQEQADSSASHGFLNMQPQTPRGTGKRKSQQKRTVCHVRAENLSTDVWAWRKYGQKPIKGSPYPRNYYRCSSLKGCLARKQVERSNTDPNIFVITCTGDHTHPHPTHRNTLAGSTRNKFNSMSTQKPTGSITSDSGSPTSVSPTTPLTVQREEILEAEKKETFIGEEENECMEEKMTLSEDEEDILIPNTAMSDDVFFGFPELGSKSTGGCL